jgi:Superfamily I DNA and RNA helicases
MATPGFRAFVWKRPSAKLMTLHSSKGLEFPLVLIAGLDAMPWKGEPMDEELRLLYVGMTRATHELVLSAAGTSPMVQRVHNSLEAVALSLQSKKRMFDGRKRPIFRICTIRP